jgi:hypothetical protein
MGLINVIRFGFWDASDASNPRRRAELLLLGGLVISVAVTVTAQAQSSQRDSIARIVEQVKAADYGDDRAALKRLHKDLEPFAGNKELASRVRYWMGFALWRRALNGFNDSVDSKELEADLIAAVHEFDEATALDAGFVDAKVGAAACLMSAAFIDQTKVKQELLSRCIKLFGEVRAADPENPRFLWVYGGAIWYSPAERGGGEGPGVATFEKGLKSAQIQRKSADPLEPSWGEPEMMMNLAWANLNRATPDLAAAEQYARKALALVPNWHYVRDILLKQIIDARDKPKK